MNLELPTLLLLQRELTTAIYLMQSEAIAPLTDKERRAYKLQYGEYDFVIGDFGIKKLNESRP